MSGGIWEFLKYLLKPNAAPVLVPIAAKSLGQFCTDNEAERCLNEINRLVTEFVERRRLQRRPGHINLGAGSHLELGDPDVRFRTILTAHESTGWRLICEFRYALLVTNDGRWQYQGWHSWHGKDYARDREASLWSGHPDGWTAINGYEISHVVEQGTATPAFALECFRRALEQWDSS